jgi:hypothetical protein
MIRRGAPAYEPTSHPGVKLVRLRSNLPCIPGFSFTSMEF